MSVSNPKTASDHAGEVRVAIRKLAQQVAVEVSQIDDVDELIDLQDEIRSLQFGVERLGDAIGDRISRVQARRR